MSEAAYPQPCGAYHAPPYCKGCQEALIGSPAAMPMPGRLVEYLRAQRTTTFVFEYPETYQLDGFDIAEQTLRGDVPLSEEEESVWLIGLRVGVRYLSQDETYDETAMPLRFALKIWTPPLVLARMQVAMTLCSSRECDLVVTPRKCL